MSRRTTVNYFIRSTKLTQPVCLAVVADLHNDTYQDVLPLLHSVDAILIVGDLVSRHQKDQSNALRFLQEAPQCAPTYYAIGNHERKLPDPEAWLNTARETDAVLLDNTCLNLNEEIVLGAFSSPVLGETPDARILQEMSAKPGFRLLMCHHPELFKSYVKPCDIDLTLAGHAHGGHWRLFGQGLYSPGQGLFPRLTRGLYEDDRLLVSMGMHNDAVIPRFNTPCELLLLHLMPEKERSDEDAE